jgi:alanine-synthesizing transaminase
VEFWNDGFKENEIQSTYCVGNSKIIEGLGKIKGYLRLALVENEERLRQAVRQIKRALQEIDHEI